MKIKTNLNLKYTYWKRTKRLIKSYLCISFKKLGEKQSIKPKDNKMKEIREKGRELKKRKSMKPNYVLWKDK